MQSGNPERNAQLFCTEQLTKNHCNDRITQYALTAQNRQSCTTTVTEKRT